MAKRERATALAEQQQRFEDATANESVRTEQQRAALEAQIATLTQQLDSARNIGELKDVDAQRLAADLDALGAARVADSKNVQDLYAKLEQQEVSRNRREYEWGAEREELIRDRDSAIAEVKDLQSQSDAAREREVELIQRCADGASKLEQMKKVMDEQELEMTTRLERVQQYVKERQTGALQAEKKQQDAERLADRWQNEVKRVQAERDKLAAMVLDLETHKADQGRLFQGAQEQHLQDVSALHATLKKKEEDMRAANLELLKKREEEYAAKISLEKQREKDRSMATLRKKEQELQIKDQQLRGTKQRMRELEGASPLGTTSPAGTRRLSTGESQGLPPLSAR